MKNANLALFLSLYGLQGIIVAYLFNYNKTYMTSFGVTESDAAWVETFALLPMVLKFLYGPLSDRINLLSLGHRRPWIGLGLIAQFSGLAGLATVNPASGQSLWYALFALLAVSGLALNDTCCDGMVVDVTPHEDRAEVQSWLWTARFTSATFTTFLFGTVLTKAADLHFAIWACCLLSIVPFLLNIRAKEAERLDEENRFHWSALGAMLEPRSLALLGFGGLYGLSGVAVEMNLAPFYEKAVLLDPLSDVAQLGSLRYLGRAAGAFLLPLLWLRLRRSQVLALGIILLGVTILGQLGVGGRGTADVWAILFGMSNGLCDALFATLAMECASPLLAASTFALFMAVTNISILGNSLFAGLASNGTNFPFALKVMAVLAFSSLVPAWFLRNPPPTTPMRADLDVA